MMAKARPNTSGSKLLASLRQKAELTQAELAKRAKVSRSMVAQLEIDERSPSRKLLRALCRAMDVSEEEERQLLLEYGFRPSGQTPEQIAAFLRADKNLSPDQAERLANLVREAYDQTLSEQQMM